MDRLDIISQLFETYRGHDYGLSLIGYNCTMLSGLCSNESRKKEKLKTLSHQISNCRVILRFLDDFSMLSYTISYGLGKDEKNFVIRVLNVINNLASHMYYIFEHIAWLADNKILNISSDIYWTISILSWLISLLASLICWKFFLSENCVKLSIQIFKDIFWAINAIHWLPKGFLWSSKLSDFSSGLFGVLAVLLSLIYKIKF